MNNKRKIYEIIGSLVPPALFKAIKDNRFYPAMKNSFNKIFKLEMIPAWNIVRAGLLKDKNIFFSPAGVWQREMLDGEYDKFIFDYLEKFDFRGKAILDIGAHIGFHTMSFAQLVGDSGKVYSFEPNIFNLERIKKNLLNNGLMQNTVKVFNFALSDRAGKEEFLFSSDIEGGSSSGGFLGTADTLWGKEYFIEKSGFKKVEVEVFPLDDIAEILDSQRNVALMKIDVEGAETQVLAGAKKTINKFKPLILLEVHSISNMFGVCRFFEQNDYKMEMLKEEADGRCFLAASPK